jgi:hypothetical protein
MDKIIKTILKNKVLIIIVFITIIIVTNKQMNKRENFDMNEIWTIFDSQESKPVEEEEDECSEE